MKAKRQYTVRNIPRSVDLALRKKAQQQHRSLNAVLLDAIVKESAVGFEARSFDDLDHLIGSWISDSETEKALSEQRQVDVRDWDAKK